MRIAKDTILTFEHGEFSDYSFSGPYRVAKDFDQATVADEYRENWRSVVADARDDRPTERGFIVWMARQGYVEDIPNSVGWHVGSYSDFTPEIAIAPAPTKQEEAGGA